MKPKSLLAAVVAVLLLLPAAAQARKITKKDRAVAKKAMGYLGAMAKIIEKGIDKPKVALDKLEAYTKKNRAAFQRIAEKLDAIEKALDDDEKEKFKQYLTELPEMKRFMEALMAFMQKHASDQAIADRLMKILESLEPKKKDEAEAKPKKAEKKPKSD